MNSLNFYDYQTRARQLNTPADVDAIARKMTPLYRRLVRQWLPPSRNAAIYEVACGPGIMMRFLKTEGYTTFSGSDLAACQVDLAKASGLPAKQADSLQELRQQPDKTWDCIIGIDFVEHLTKDEFIGFLLECHRTLKPGGCLILRLPNGSSPLVGLHLFNDITHQWTYTENAMRAILNMAGFDTVAFADETVPSIQEHRWLKVPLAFLIGIVARFMIRAVSRERPHCLSPSFFVGAWRRGTVQP
jgi:2-polyprenyl-3-methyl-5-hydroxy-6-metoxy-1,4-benzoquinol methylase